ncbi:hypothetical protein [Halomontanus rarus]|uniref:hypothetical protein n=1 Tax=Halomontanus rarus TaxID=3034020 RepID=UPI00293BC536|nr:hypothetical protein [Halovivax sp. KZCA124]
MTRELRLDFDVDSETQIEKLTEIIREECPSISVRSVEKVIAADGGPVDYLGWLVLEGDDDCFFYDDDDPDQEALRWLMSISPRQSDLPDLKRILQRQYNEYAEGDLGVIIEIPDIYLPGTQPKVLLGMYHNPITDDLATGAVAKPVSQQDEILADIDKQLPARDLETFIMNAARTLQTDFRTEAERHLLDGDVTSVLEQDPHFRRETETDVPDGIHPGYSGKEAELWQKPVSRVDSLSGAQGFVQVWIPIDDDDVALVAVTRGDFDHEEALDTVRSTILEDATSGSSASQ